MNKKAEMDEMLKVILWLALMVTVTFGTVFLVKRLTNT